MTDVINHVMRKVPEIKSIQRPFVTLQMYDNFILSRNTKKTKQQVTSTSDASENATSSSKESEKEMITSFRENHGINAALFIHGFSGQAHDSFGSIPKLLAQDSQMDGWDLFPIGFSESFTPEMGHDIWASVHDLQKLADNIASSLKYKYTDYKRVALIGHSLGGIALQMAVLQMSAQERQRISHVVCLGSPNKGVNITDDKDPDKRIAPLEEKGVFISQLRKQWNIAFEKGTPFKLMNAIGTQDSMVTVAMSFGVFNPTSDVLVAGDHFSMVQPEGTQHDGYQLIIKTLTDSKFANAYTNKEEINLLLGNYDAIIRELWPDRHDLGAKGIRNLLFALEGMDRLDDAIELAESKVEDSGSLHLMGLLAGRVKRRYLQNMKDADGDLSFQLYKKAYDLAVAENNNDQQYFLAINLAFLSLIHEEDRSMMQNYATLSRKLAQQDPFDSVWKAATIAESSMYLADFKTAEEQYAIAALNAGVREKISMHANAYLAYTTLKQTTNDDFVRFLKRTFLS
jgi:pimeloyl-ACP methyl ester carboxylesterase